MLIKNIRIIDEIIDIENDSVDVCVECEDGSTYIVSIATTKSLFTKNGSRKK